MDRRPGLYCPLTYSLGVCVRAVLWLLQILGHKPPQVGDNHKAHPARRFAQDLLIPCRHTDASACMRRFHNIHSRADVLIAIAVMLNMAVIMLYHYGMAPRFQRALDLCNQAFLVLFGLEMVFKMFALGMVRYWREPANVFDGVIVIGSSAVEVLSLYPAFARFSFISQVRNDAVGTMCGSAVMGAVTCGVARSPRCLQVARLLRVGRLLRLLQNFPRLRKLFETIILALPSMGNVTALLLLVLFVGTIIGMELFGDVRVPVLALGCCGKGPASCRHHP